MEPRRSRIRLGPVTLSPIRRGGRPSPSTSGVDLENGKEAVEATLFELVDVEYREAARSVVGVLRSTKPWPFEADLRALATGR